MKRITGLLPANGHLSDEMSKAAMVLVVEDDVMVCALVREILISDGYMVLAAYNGAEALDIVVSYCGAIDLLLTDIVLPRMGGKQLVESALALRPGLKALYMSGYPVDTLKSFGWPSLPYIQKPFSAKHLTKRVRELLSVDPCGLDSSEVLDGPNNPFRIDVLPDCNRHKGGQL